MEHAPGVRFAGAVCRQLALGNWRRPPSSNLDGGAAHRPLGAEVALYRAPFWSPTQRAFLKEAIIEDADWAGVIDELNELLH